tara:strand:+ start:5287 stop:5475 length:189 start_codon:yes stop_codon:yes gene_type:complete
MSIEEVERKIKGGHYFFKVFEQGLKFTLSEIQEHKYEMPIHKIKAIKKYYTEMLKDLDRLSD